MATGRRDDKHPASQQRDARHEYSSDDLFRFVVRVLNNRDVTVRLSLTLVAVAGLVLTSLVISLTAAGVDITRILATVGAFGAAVLGGTTGVVLRRRQVLDLNHTRRAIRKTGNASQRDAESDRDARS
jgi:hypothetical protein